MTTNRRCHVIGTATTTRYFCKAEFSRVTENGKAVFKIGKVYYYLNTSLLKYNNEEPILSELISGQLVELELMIETTPSTHKISKMFLVGYREISQNHNLNVGWLYAWDEEEFQFELMSTSPTSNPNLYLAALKNIKTEDIIFCRVWEDISDLVGKQLSPCTLQLASTQNQVRLVETSKAYECFVEWRDREYTDGEGKKVIKRDEKVFVPVLELPRRIFVQVKEDIREK